ncbi:MAG: GntR family transcriptional regulator [Candidatus Borkfalkiaceae bacterium]|nr:GntR family transcriptional regulator [Christensenellaceae bacterium]
MKKDFLYNRVIDYVMDIIKQHPDEENYKLPSERQLQLKLGVSSITVKSALKKLQEKNLIVRRQGQGSFINPKVLTSSAPEKPVYNFLVSLNSLGSHYVNQIILGIQDYCRRKNINCFFTAHFNNKTSETTLLKTFPESPYDGMIIFPVDGNYFNRALLQLVVDKTPIVIIDREYQGVKASFVASNHYGVTYDTVCSLIDEGVTDIALILPLSYNISSVLDRYRGYIDAFIARGVIIKRQYILDRYYDNENNDFQNASANPCPPQTIEKWTNDYIAFLTKNPDVKAIITINGISFLACVNAARKLKASCNRDLRIFVYDDDNEELASITDVKFVTLRQHGYQIGKQAAAQLYGLITHTAGNKKIIIDFRKE